MAQNVMITGTGREMALGFNFVRRYLEQGDTVFATVRKPSPALEKLREQYPENLHILTMDISSTESVQAAAEEAAKVVDHLDLLINNAVTTSPDCGKEFRDANLDYIAGVVDVGAVGPLRVIKAMLPLLEQSAGTALIANISSEAGSIGKCYRTNMIDYAMAKCALNMGTMTLKNAFRGNEKLNIICVHPGWVRTSPAQAAAPFDPYDSAEILRKLFEEKRCDFDGPVFVQYDGTEYPW
ncbi:MAG: SDR family NAD(P)-dependent oxidoreductase [Ruminococcaceae bacterium]|nr:SDR family NAD(P)-dependent oxidoreductase [Oscillospiraceae bacterium]